jgi:hypothetical protein
MYMEDEALLSTLAECYLGQGIVADRLPYTDAFERLLEDVQRRTGMKFGHAAFWLLLTNARKRGLLPRMVR